jgi:hypothetical protein
MPGMWTHDSIVDLLTKRGAKVVPHRTRKRHTVLAISASDPGKGFYFVRRDGALRIGMTVRESRVICPVLRTLILGPLISPAGEGEPAMRYEGTG